MQFRAFIPQANVGGFRGDNRGFSADKNASSRVAVTVRIEQILRRTTVIRC